MCSFYITVVIRDVVCAGPFIRYMFLVVWTLNIPETNYYRQFYRIHIGNAATLIAFFRVLNIACIC